MMYRDLIVDYINSDASKSERINLSREELNEIANMLFTFHNVKDYIEPLRNCNTNNKHLEALKRIVRWVNDGKTYECIIYYNVR